MESIECLDLSEKYTFQCEDPLYDEFRKDPKLEKAANDCVVALTMNVKGGFKIMRIYETLMCEYFKAYCELTRKAEQCEILQSHEARDFMIRHLLSEKIKNLA